VSQQDTFFAAIKAQLVALPSLGITTVYGDVVPAIPPEALPAVVVFFRNLNETRISSGEKDVDFTIDLMVYQLGTFEGSDADGIAHRNFVEAIVARLRTGGAPTYGAHRGFDNFRFQRIYPEVNNGTFPLVTIVTTDGSLFTAG